MTFTELEYLLMLAVAVLLWRNSKLDEIKRIAIDDSNRYAYYLMQIGRGKGRVKKEGNSFRFQEITNENQNQ